MTAKPKSPSQLIDPTLDAAGAKLRKAFHDAEQAVKAKMTAEFGDNFIQTFSDRMRDEVNRLPLNIEAQVRFLLEEKLNVAVKSAVESRIREFWGDFIQKEINNRMSSSDMVIALAKKVKELM